MKDYYALLGVARTASSDEIKRAFRKLAVQYHPDKNPDPAAAEIFKEVSEAYDTLSDWESRKQYDLRWENPFITQNRPEQQTRKHRDPRYRPKPPGYQPAGSYSTKEMMRDYLPHVRVVSYLGLAFAILLALDLVLPYTHRIEEVHSVESRNKSRENGIFTFVTTKGKEIIVRNNNGKYLTREKVIRYSHTRIFKTVMSVSDKGPTYKITLAYIYRTLFFFPLILLMSSVIAIVYRKNYEFPFNMGVVSGLFFILTVSIMILI